MTERIIPALSFSCGALATSYIALMVMTIFFATWQTEAMNSVRVSEGQIGNMETSYYAAMDHASELSPATLGFVTPQRIAFVPSAVDTSTGLSFAGN
jgi:hypothetical protein